MQIAILIFIGFIILVGWVISSIQSAAESSRRNKEHKEKIKQKWSGRQIDRNISLEERNDDIIQQHLRRIRGGYQRHYYIENSVRDCIQDIAEAEGNLSMAPNYSYLSNWIEKATPEYKALSDSLLKRFREQQKKIEEKEKEKEALEKQEKIRNIKTKYADLIKQFYEITERKVSLVDDYGEENWDVLDKEIDLLIQKIAKKQGHSDEDFKKWKKHDWYLPDEYAELSRYLKSSFKQYHKRESAKPIAQTDYTKMSGIDFESHLVKLLKENGFSNVRGTPVTGDQGADLIAERDGRTIIIQAKRYEGSVGNKAVQEVASAVSFYGGDEGWVITNSFFTKSAKELAQRTGIKLIDGRDLARFSELFGKAGISASEAKMAVG